MFLINYILLYTLYISWYQDKFNIMIWFSDDFKHKRNIFSYTIKITIRFFAAYFGIRLLINAWSRHISKEILKYNMKYIWIIYEIIILYIYMKYNRFRNLSYDIERKELYSIFHFKMSFLVSNIRLANSLANLSFYESYFILFILS